MKWHFPVPVQAGGAWVGVHLSSGSGAVGRELLRLAGPPRSFEAKYANLGCGGVDRDLLRIPRAPALVRANEGG